MPRDRIADNCELVGVVRMGTMPTRQTYMREPASLRYSDYPLHKMGSYYDSQVSRPNFDTALGGDPPTIQRPSSFLIGGDIELLGYDLHTHTVPAGDPVSLTLYWRAGGR